ncbi:hypothetical protein DUZ99_12695 [Xylanibacillus composti]|uniref:Uncharacterized protein n=1 Tax=Xylanibacillus composti TaxID=1572762 RepID=A0A8J4M355_9BACL|nr:hypothetical protein [Xylanibacillus composti]MDT9725830.1 hypothetical protein [Xylanibacillus composti]GIQ69216.1 hypothetical protein XYCOK13_20400 [Xylanibacillus composti]
MNPLFMLLVPLLFLGAALWGFGKLKEAGRGERLLAGAILGVSLFLYLCAVLDYEPWMPNDLYKRLAIWFQHSYIEES